eukprot:1124690-Pelagomonas_calceolata.AAC.2
MLLDVAGVIYTPHTLASLQEYAYILASARRALEKTPLSSHHQHQARARMGTYFQGVAGLPLKDCDRIDASMRYSYNP